MPRRRGLSRGKSLAATRRGASAGAQRNTCSRQPLSRYGHQPARDFPSAIREYSERLQSNTEIIDARDPEYPGTPPTDSPIPHESPPHSRTIFSTSPASRSPSEPNTRQNTS